MAASLSTFEASPYPGAKKYFYIGGDLWDDIEWLTHLITITAKELPPRIYRTLSPE